MNVLAFLAVLLVGVLLGFWLQNPALAERERAMRQQVRRTKALWRDAQNKLETSACQLRFVQAVREQTVGMLDFASRAPELGPLGLGMAASPIFEGMTNWLAPTGAMPQLEERATTPPKRKPRKVTVKVGDAPAEEVLVP